MWRRKSCVFRVTSGLTRHACYWELSGSHFESFGPFRQSCIHGLPSVNILLGCMITYCWHWDNPQKFHNNNSILGWKLEWLYCPWQVYWILGEFFIVQNVWQKGTSNHYEITRDMIAFGDIVLTENCMNAFCGQLYFSYLFIWPKNEKCSLPYVPKTSERIMAQWCGVERRKWP